MVKHGSIGCTTGRVKCKIQEGRWELVLYSQVVEWVNAKKMKVVQFIII